MDEPKLNLCFPEDSFCEDFEKKTGLMYLTNSSKTTLCGVDINRLLQIHYLCLVVRGIAPFFI